MNDSNSYREDARTLEERANQKRSEINRTLSQIEDRFSPGQVVDQAMGLFREHGGEMASNLGRSVRDNPVPMILTGVGLAWMALSQSSSQSRNYGAYHDGYQAYRSNRYEQNQRTAYGSGPINSDNGYRRASPDSPAGYETASTVAGLNTANREHGDDQSLLDKARDAGAEAREKLAEVQGRASHQYQQGAQYARETAQEWQERADRQMQELRGSVRSTTEDASRFMREQPLVAGAAGIALGAFIGALLPPTRIEDRLAGKYSDSITDEVEQAADEKLKQGAGAARERIEQVAEDARKSASEKLTEVETRAQSISDPATSSVENV